jgi:uncharacterized protein (DUF2267 family)
LTAAEGLRFASVLPAVPRAIFVAGWVPHRPAPALRPACRDDGRGRALRPNHNLTPDNAIAATARAVWRSVNHAEFDRVLDTLPEGARAFWTVPGADPADLATRMS